MLALTIALHFPRGNLGIDVAGYLAHHEPHLESIRYVCAEVSDHDRWQHLSPKWGRKARALLHLTLTKRPEGTRPKGTTIALFQRVFLLQRPKRTTIAMFQRVSILQVQR